MCRVNPLVPCMSAQTARKISNIPASLLVPKSTQLQTHLTKRWFFPYLGGIQATGSDRPLGPSYADPPDLSLWTVSLIFFQKPHCSDVSVPCGSSSSLLLGIPLAQFKRFCWGIEVAVVQNHRGIDCQALLLAPRLWVLPMLRAIPSPKGMSILWFDVTGLGLRASKSLKALSWSPRHKKGQCATHTGMLCS